MTKGHRATRHSLYRRAKESMLHALSYAYAHRRERKGDMRRLWIVRVSAASRAQGLSYGQFIYGLKQAGGQGEGQRVKGFVCDFERG
jgi:large subunit ribosomal protein L20